MNKKPPKGKSLADRKPDLAKYWHPTENGRLTTNDVYPCTDKKYWWKCPNGHEYKASTKSGPNGLNCLTCKTFENSIEKTHPHLVKEWHPTKNNAKKPGDYNYGSNKKIWWKCYEGIWEGGKRKGEYADDHQWEATIKSRTSGRGCRICRGEIAVPSNCLATVDPNLAKQWHPKLNIIRNSKNEIIGKKLAKDFTKGMNEKIWWNCDKGDDHVWYSSIKSRAVDGNGCSICSGHRVVPSNCLSYTNPDIAKEWCWEENERKVPENFTYGSNEMIWWQCPVIKKHKWKTSVKTRTRKVDPTSCPDCNLTKSKEELQIRLELKTVFTEIELKEHVRDFKVPDHNSRWTFDFYIPELDLVIDYDGNYWHKDEKQIELDKLKTKLFKSKKIQNSNKIYKAFRIREQTDEYPLYNITNNDIKIKKGTKNKIKTIVNKVLNNIKKMFPRLSENNIEEINFYINQNELQNIKGYDKELKKLEKKIKNKMKEEALQI